MTKKRIQIEHPLGHDQCPDPARCACDCRPCKRAWSAVGRPSPPDDVNGAEVLEVKSAPIVGLPEDAVDCGTCPCGGRVWASLREFGTYHATPTCIPYEEMEADAFLVYVRRAQGVSDGLADAMMSAVQRTLRGKPN